MSYVKACAMTFVGALGLLAATQAQAITMADLLASNQSITVGDKVYSNFSYLSAKMPADQVAVNFVPDVGIQFGAAWNTAYAGMMDSVIGYTVSETANSGKVISGVGLSFAGLIALDGAVAAVGESVINPANNQETLLHVVWDGSGPLVDKTSDFKTINPGATSLIVKKDITVTPVQGVNTSFAMVTFVDNTFQQTPGGGTPPPIPEPMSLALLPLGLIGLGLRKKLARS